MTCNEVLERYDRAVSFFIHEKEAKHLSAGSIKNHRMFLQMFRDFFESIHKDDETVKDPSYLDIQMWRDDMAEKGTAVGTIVIRMRSVQHFFSVCSDDSLGEDKFYQKNPVTRRMYPDSKFAYTKPYDDLLTDEEIVRLWDNTPVRKRGAKVRRWARNYAIVMTLLATEVRNKELLDLRLSDLDFEFGEIQIFEGKGNKYRCVDFPEIAQTAVKLYLQSGLRPGGLSDDDYLFGTTRVKERGSIDDSAEWHRGTERWLTELVERHVKLVTGVSNIRTHDLRHVGARLDLHNGMRAEELQAKLGHENLSTTQIYSGKLGANRKRTTAKRVYEARDFQAKRNQMMLASAG